MNHASCQLKRISQAAARGLFFAALLLPLHLQAEPGDAQTTLVVYNKNDPKSEEIALYYSIKREIPGANLCGVECPVKEEITREEYNKTLLRPLREFVQTHD